MSLKKSIIGLVVLFTLPINLPSHAGYRSVLNKWTQSKQWYSTQTFQANIIWHATYFSPELRRAQTQRHIEKKYLNPMEAARYVAEQEKRQAASHEFFLGIYARKPYRQITSGNDSFWEVVLTTEQGEIAKPTSLEIVDIEPYEKVMYPYLNRWSKGYRVVFPKAALGSNFKLTLRSVLGESTVKWDL